MEAVGTAKPTLEGAGGGEQKRWRSSSMAGPRGWSQDVPRGDKAGGKWPDPERP